MGTGSESESNNGAVPEAAHQSRRTVLRTGALAVGASLAAVAGSSRAASAVDGDPIEIGASNIGSSTTALSSLASGGETIRAENTDTTGRSEGLYGITNSPLGRGVLGTNSASTGDAIGVQGATNSSTGRGVYGTAFTGGGGTGRGVLGVYPDSGGVGVEGMNDATTGDAVGVQGTSASSSGAGVLGQATSGMDSVGVFGRGGGAGVVGTGGRYGAFVASDGVGGFLAGDLFGAGVVGDLRVTDEEEDFDFSTGPVASVAPVHVIRSGSGQGVELMLQLESDTAPQQTFVNNSTAAKWFFAMTSDDEFKISRDGTGKVEAKFFGNGNLNIAGTLNQASDVNVKHDLEDVDAGDVLERLASMPVRTWKYDADPGVTHLGPTAQDFRAAFGLGESDTTIATVDANGVALAAIQALHEQNQHLQAQLDELRDRLG